MNQKDIEKEIGEAGNFWHGCQYKSVLFRSFWALQKIFILIKYFFMARIAFFKMSGLQEELAKSERIDIFPGYGNGRGFVVVIDGKKSLFFSQDGDHFVYDGWEIGEYEGGDVTIFDKIEN